MTGIEFRPLRPSDAERVVDVLLASRAVDGPSDPIGRDLLRHLWFEFPGLDLERDTFAAAGADGRVVGFAGSYPREHPTHAARVFVPGTVDPAHRRRGIGRHLLRAAEARAREQLAQMTTDLPRQIDCDAPEGSVGRIVLFEAEGYRPIRTFASMRRDLREPLPTPADVPGMTWATWRTELDEAIRLAHNDAFQDHWGSDPLGPERWQHFVHGSPGFSADCSWLALDGATVAGYALCWLGGTEDRRVGWLGTIGVRRAYRRRGIGSAVIARSLASFRASGLTSAGLDVDAENPTGAVRVYESLGFAVTDRSIVYSKSIPA